MSNKLSTSAIVIAIVAIVVNLTFFAVLVGNRPNQPALGSPTSLITSAATIAGTNVATSTTEVIAANVGRQSLIITNDSDTNVYCAVGIDAVLNQGTRLNANGGVWEIVPPIVYTKEIDCIHGGAGNKVVVTQEW